ncbi:hypothetical protein LDENG_00205520, partial [Lucifuga dentata]
YRNICAEFRLEVPKSKWETPPKVIEIDRAKNLWDLKFQTNMQPKPNQPDMVVVNKEQQRAAVVHAAVPSDATSGRKNTRSKRNTKG